MTVEELLRAPCEICGYNGQGYWQKGTHSELCPFRTIGGQKGRMEFVKMMWGEAMYDFYNAPEPNDDN